MSPEAKFLIVSRHVAARILSLRPVSPESIHTGCRNSYNAKAEASGVKPKVNTYAPSRGMDLQLYNRKVEESGKKALCYSLWNPVIYRL